MELLLADHARDGFEILPELTHRDLSLALLRNPNDQE
jgi:hypothetical protein